MASARIPYNPSSVLGSRFATAIGHLVSARRELEELHRILDKYLDDEQAIADDSGIHLAHVALVRNLVNQAKAELAETAIIAVEAGAVSGSRQLADAMG